MKLKERTKRLLEVWGAVIMILSFSYAIFLCMRLDAEDEAKLLSKQLMEKVHEEMRVEVTQADVMQVFEAWAAQGFPTIDAESPAQTRPESLNSNTD